MLPLLQVLIIASDKEKASAFLQRLPTCSLVKVIDELNTAAFFAVGYRANTKLRSPHNCNLLSVLVYHLLYYTTTVRIWTSRVIGLK
jgi:hypothetical protein